MQLGLVLENSYSLIFFSAFQSIDWQQRKWPLFSSFCSLFPPLFFSSVATFSHKRSARIKKLIQQKLIRAPKTLEAETFPDSVGHLWAPYRPFWIFQVMQVVSKCPHRHQAGIPLSILQSPSLQITLKYLGKIHIWQLLHLLALSYLFVQLLPQKE